MLENPQDETVVRWGNEGDSFVVLEACHLHTAAEVDTLTACTEREVHETYPAETLQTQQLRELRAPAQQIRFPQSAAQQRRGRPVTVRARGMVIIRASTAGKANTIGRLGSLSTQTSR